MKALFISYNQSLTECVQYVLEKNMVRGHTKMPLTHGRGSVSGEPHYGTHAWPAVNSSILAIVEDDQVNPLLDDLRKLDAKAEQHGVRAFVWEVVGQM